MTSPREPSDEAVRRVVVVEDDAFQALWLARLLERNGYDVDGPFYDARTALRAIESDPPDAAILDLDLRGSRRGAPETCAEVARSLDTWSVPYILYTSHDRIGLITPGQPPARRLFKPSSDEALLEAVGGLFARENLIPA